MKLFLFLVVAAGLAVADAGIFDFLGRFFQSGSGEAATGGQRNSANVNSPAPMDDLLEEEMKYPVLSAEEYSVLINTSKQALQRQNVGDAMDHLITALEADPFAHEPNLLLGMTLINKMKRPDLAESFLYRAVTASEWKDVASISNLALCLLRNSAFDLAAQVSKEGMRIAAKLGDEALLTAQDILGQVLGLLAYQQHHYGESSEWYFSSAVAGAKRFTADTTGATMKNENVWLKASTLSFPGNHFDGPTAKSVLLEAMKYYPTSQVLVYNLAKAHHLTEEFDLAVQLYMQAIDLDRTAAKERIDAGQEDVVAKEGETQLAASTDIPAAWGSLATALFSLGEYQRAHESFEKAFQIQPSNPVMLANWALLLCQENVAHYDEGALIAERARGVDGKNADVLRALKLCGRGEEGGE
jgi:tetratricopeptide (TPR) repeat protein